MIFDLQLFRRLADASASAYHSRPTVASRETDTEVLIQNDPQLGVTLVCFRGTSEFRDVITDSHFGLRSIHGGRVHHGVADAVDSVLADLVIALSSRPRPIYFTGHSLGGAEAMLAAFILQTTSLDVAGVVTFGSPRWCDNKLRDAYDAVLGSSTMRIVAEHDIVPHLPPAGLILRYRHAGDEVYLTDDGRAKLFRSNLAMVRDDLATIYQAHRAHRGAAVHFPWELHSNHAVGRYQELLAHLSPTSTTATP